MRDFIQTTPSYAFYMSFTVTAFCVDDMERFLDEEIYS